MKQTSANAHRFPAPQPEHKSATRTRCLIAGVGLLSLQLFSAATCFAAIDAACWDAASEFNDTANPDAANPSGVWSYGWKKTLTDKFFLFTAPCTEPPDLFGWSSASGFPLACQVSRPVPILTRGVNRGTFPPHVLDMHPGPNGEYAVLRFSAPADGNYKISGQFYGLDENDTGTTTDVWILKNNEKANAFSGQVNYYGGPKWTSFTGTRFALKRGDTLDFQVGYGVNKTYFYDSTGLMALIEKIQ